MANDVFGGLLSGLAAGLGAWGQGELAERQAAKQAARQAALNAQEADLKLRADESAARLKARWALPEHVTYEATGPDGRIVKRTISQRIDPGTGQPTMETLGEAVQPMEAPKSREVRMGDQIVTQEFDPRTGEYREVGRGAAFAPRGRGAGGPGSAGGDDGTDSGAAPGEATYLDPQGVPRPVGKAADWVVENGVRVNKLTGAEFPLTTAQSAAEAQKAAAAKGEAASKIVEAASGAREQLQVLDQMEKLLGQTSTGPLDQYISTSPKNAQRFDTLAKQLLGPTVKAMFGGTQISDADRKAAEAALPAIGKYEDVNKDVIRWLRESAQKRIAREDALKGGKLTPQDMESALAEFKSPSFTPTPRAGKYSVGQIIEANGKKYRVTGGDPDDPDVEEVK